MKGLMSVKELAEISGVSVKTLHHYHKIGLLHPTSIGTNGYRYYSKDDIRQLQQVLLYRNLQFPLAEIKEILHHEGFNLLEALEGHKSHFAKKLDEMKQIALLIEKTIKDVKGEMSMTDKEYFEGFNPRIQKEYEKEVVERFGKAGEKLVQDSHENTKDWTKEDWVHFKRHCEKLGQEFGIAFKEGHTIDDAKVQHIVGEQYKMIKQFYLPTKDIFLGLAEMYVDDPKFKAFYDEHGDGVAEFVSEAMKVYASNWPHS